MDFGTILHKAQKNGNIKKEPIRYYSTKFEPPKKEQRSKTQQLSANIKRFLEKREQEEKLKQLEAQKKKDELLTLRSKDKKAMKRVNVMLKRTKSANQSVIQDAVDTENTAVTLAGPIQPDEDDYGYVSQEASAFYNKMMEKYSKMPEGPPKFSLDKKKSNTNLNSTKDRVKAALEKEENLTPGKRKRTIRDVDGINDENEREEVKKISNNEKIRPKMPPPMNFNELLKLAEKKQFEPIVIEKKPKEEVNPLTKKQKKEQERVREWQERRNDKNNIPGDSVVNSKKTSNEVPKSKMTKVVECQKSEPEQVRKKIDWGLKHPAASKMNSTTPKPPPSQESKLKTNNNNVSKPVKDSAIERNPIQQKIMKPKEFPPRDIIKPKLKPLSLPAPPPDAKRRMMEKAKLKKRHILDDDEDEDSEMDDFIDDGPEEAEQDYSKYIKEIFGYNKSKYANMDDDEDIMETSFAQQMKEEVISRKMGLMEDLEDMKLEEEHKRRKALLKKKLSKRQ